MQTSKEVVAEIIADIPELELHKDEFVIFMDKIKDIESQKAHAQSHHERKEIAMRIRNLSEKMSQNHNGEGRELRNKAINRIFDHILGGEDD